MERWDVRWLLNNWLNANATDEKEEKGKKRKQKKRPRIKKKLEKCIREEFWRKASVRRWGQKWRLSGDDRQGTPPRTISPSIARIPSRERSCRESEVVEAANCLFSGLLLKHLHFHTKRQTRFKASGKKTRVDFFPLRAFCCCVDAMIKLNLWII